jgi:hypothetical protein
MLSQQNVTFSKAIQNLQEDFLETIKDLCLIHLAIKGISEKTELKSFSLVMTRPSYIEEKNRIENDGALLDLAGKYTSMGINRRWVAKHVMHKSDAEIEEMFEIDPTAPQAGAEAGGMGGGMMGGDMGDLGTGGLPTEQMPQAEMQPEAPQQAIPGAELGGQMPAAAVGNTPLMQSNRYYVGGLLVETFDTICEASRINTKIFKLQESIKDGGLVAPKDAVRVTRVILEQKKSKLTEPEEIFEQ